MEKEIEVNGKKFKVHEILAIEFDKIMKIEDKVDGQALLIKKSADLTDEDYAVLTYRERKQINEVVNDINGWTKDFRKLETEEKQT